VLSTADHNFLSITKSCHTFVPQPFREYLRLVVVIVAQEWAAEDGATQMQREEGYICRQADLS